MVSLRHPGGRGAAGSGQMLGQFNEGPASFLLLELQSLPGLHCRTAELVEPPFAALLRFGANFLQLRAPLLPEPRTCRNFPKQPSRLYYFSAQNFFTVAGLYCESAEFAEATVALLLCFEMGRFIKKS